MQSEKTRNMILSAMMTALICVCAIVVVPFGPVPFSMSTFALCVAGALLPPGWAAAAVAVYLLLGCVGLPVFAGFAAGPGVLLGSTGGFLAGYIPLAVAVSVAGRVRTGLAARCIGAAIGFLALYAAGIAWFMVFTGRGFAAAFTACCLPFLLPDAIKCAAALFVAAAVQKRMRPWQTSK